VQALKSQSLDNAIDKEVFALFRLNQKVGLVEESEVIKVAR
jgi:hypothetical protein